MADRWILFLFDWPRYQLLLPHLRIASRTGIFTAPGLADAEEFLQDFDERREPAAACSAILIELCTLGDPLELDGGFAELMHDLRRRPNGQEPSELLAELVSAVPNLEPSLTTAEGIAGILAPGQVRDLADYFALFRKTYRAPAPPRGLAALARRFTTTESATEQLPDLMDFVDQACVRGLGLAAMKKP
jgi:hypothetical protein